MNKYPCGLIEDLIPLYIEGDINSDTREIVEEHLKECKNCSSLVLEYSNDELKMEDLKEDLPQADTFKKWMRRLKVWGSIAVIAIILSAVAIGVLGYKAGEDSRNNLLTLKTIVKTFNKQDLYLKENKSKSPEDFRLNEIKPAVFSVGESGDTLLIYIFKSVSERDEVLRKTNKFNNEYTFEEVPYKAKNALIVYISAQVPQTEEALAKYVEKRDLISGIVFRNLNDGKEIVYKGESESWEGTFTVKYYENWTEDEKGLYFDSYSWKKPSIKYKGADIDTVGPITFEYKAAGGGGSSTGLMLNKDGCAEAGFSGSTGSSFDESRDVTFTVKWGGKEEHFVLKAQ